MRSTAITFDALHSRLTQERGKVRRSVEKAIERAARRWCEFLKREIDRRGVTHSGALRDSLVVTTSSGRATVHSDHPAAGVIESGCAPHPVSEIGQQMIQQWCVDKLGLDEKEARNAAYLICRKIREHGQEPTHVFRDSVPRLIELFADELSTLLQRESA